MFRVTTMYLTQDIKNQARINSFRDALSGQKKKSQPDKSSADPKAHGGFSEDSPGSFHDYFLDLYDAYEEKQASGEKCERSAARRKFLTRTNKTAAAADKIISRTASNATYAGDGEVRDAEVTQEFHDSAMDSRNNWDPRRSDVNAVQMVMENTLDWDYHIRYNGDTFTADILIGMIGVLKRNLHEVCPSVEDGELLSLYEELATHNWLGDFHHVGSKTQAVIRAYLNAQNGDPAFMNHMKEMLAGAVLYHNRHYFDVAHNGKLPSRVVAKILEGQEGRFPALPKP